MKIRSVYLLFIAVSLLMYASTSRIRAQQSHVIQYRPVTHESPQAQAVEFIAQIGGSTLAVAVQDDYAYLGVGPRLVVLDVADPSHPTFVSQTSPFPGAIRDIAVVGSFAFIASSDAGLRVVNISNVEAPQEVAFVDTPETASSVTVVDDYVYLTDTAELAINDSSLRVINVSAPSAPMEVGVYISPGYAKVSLQAGTMLTLPRVLDGMAVTLLGAVCALLTFLIQQLLSKQDFSTHLNTVERSPSWDTMLISLREWPDCES